MKTKRVLMGERFFDNVKDGVKVVVIMVSLSTIQFMCFAKTRTGKSYSNWSYSHIPSTSA